MKAIVNSVKENTSIKSEGIEEVFVGRMSWMIGKTINVKRLEGFNDWYMCADGWSWHKSWLTFNKKSKEK